MPPALVHWAAHVFTHPSHLDVNEGLPFDERFEQSGHRLNLQLPGEHLHIRGELRDASVEAGEAHHHLVHTRRLVCGGAAVIV
jgi:hypothetical protein